MICSVVFLSGLPAFSSLCDKTLKLKRTFKLNARKIPADLILIETIILYMIPAKSLTKAIEWEENRGHNETHPGSIDELYTINTGDMVSRPCFAGKFVITEKM